ncbi:hypothetical protein L3X38_033753 [Prunus dulcis]|uniref:CCHC-type domain-containing protein n=1 Tax=Prunus dulcis TaxID=3755 RepID=A0AAD4VGK7_PRUDU|nr:hypothetical protein L3X38_033753 [Prunus dulcis]
MSLEDLILRLRIEEDNRISKKKGVVSNMEAKANIVESNPSKQKYNSQKNNKSAKKFVPGAKGKDFKRIKGGCWVCGKPSHRAQECRYRRDHNPANSNNQPRNNQANVAKTEDALVAVV